MGQARRDSALFGLDAVFCCFLLGLLRRLIQTEAAISAKPVAAAVLLLVSHDTRLAVVAIFAPGGRPKGQKN